MSNRFQLIQTKDPYNHDILASMHHLRCDVFHRELKWSKGLNIIRNMEYDEYDQPDTYYIVRVNDDGVVDATCRLIPTSQPYMIADHYSDSVEKIPIPHTDEIWEISRFCISSGARKKTNEKVLGQLIAAAIEFGLTKNIKNYIALATDYLVPVIKRNGGWDPQLLGEKIRTPDDVSYSVIYTVSIFMLEMVRKKNNIEKCLLFEDSSIHQIRQNTSVLPERKTTYPSKKEAA